MSLVSEISMASGQDVVNTAADQRVIDKGEKRGQSKVLKKVHKAEREKLKRGRLNDLFSELGNLLEQDRQSNGKASILSDTSRMLKDLSTQVEFLRKENATLLMESRYVTSEKNELKDENRVLRSHVSELHNELQVRIRYYPAHSHSLAEATVAVPSGTDATLLLPSRPFVNEQRRPSPPRELQLFPASASARDTISMIRSVRPHAQYATLSSPCHAHSFQAPSQQEDNQRIGASADIEE